MQTNKEKLINAAEIYSFESNCLFLDNFNKLYVYRMRENSASLGLFIDNCYILKYFKRFRNSKMVFRIPTLNK